MASLALSERYRQGWLSMAAMLLWVTAADQEAAVDRDQQAINKAGCRSQQAVRMEG